MQLRYIFGGSGYGKTTYCIDEILKSSSENFEIFNIYIVPEQYTLESENKVVISSSQKAILNIRVHSFKNLAHAIFDEVGVHTTQNLEKNGKIILIKKIILDNINNFIYYKNSANTQGFVENIGDIISEFYSYQISCQQLEQYFDKNSILGSKMHDLLIIYRQYQQFIQNDYICLDTVLDLLSQKIQSSEYLKNTNIWIDSFDFFTPQEFKVIEQLMKVANKITITFNLKNKDIFYKHISNFDPYFSIKSTLNKTTSIAIENNINILDPYLLTQDESRKSKEILFLEKNYLKFPNDDEYNFDTKDIKIIKAFDKLEEIEYVAQAISNFVISHKYRYKEISVIVSSFDEYKNLIKDIFEKHDISYFFDIKTSVNMHPLTELIKSLPNIIIYNFSYDSVFRLLKTYLLDIKIEDIDILENYIIAYGIKGYKWNIENWTYNTKNNPFDLEKIDKTKKEFLEYLMPFRQNLTKDSKLKAKDFCDRIYNFLDRINIIDKLQKLVENIEDKDRIMASIHCQIWDKIVETFDKIINIIGDYEISISEFSKILEDAFLKIDLATIPKNYDSVLIGDYKRTRLPETKVLFVLGTNEGLLPASYEEKGIFLDEERNFLSSMGMQLAPDTKNKIFQENYFIYNVFSKPKDLLYISYCSDMQKLKCSMVISKIKKLFPNINEVEAKLENLVHHNFNILFDKITILLKEYKNTQFFPSEYIPIYLYFLKNDKFSDKIQKMEKIAFLGEYNENLTFDSIQKLYSSQLNMSITKLENYVKCPYYYFITYNLKAKSRQKYEIKFTDIGNIFHTVMEKFNIYLHKNKLNFKNIGEKKIIEIVDLCVEETIRDEDILSSSNQLKYLAKSIKRICRKSIWALAFHMKSGSFYILKNELEFSLDMPITGILIKTNDEFTLKITGKIDRVDIYTNESQCYIKIIDYKSGNKKFDILDIYYGMQLQLIMYINILLGKYADLIKKQNSNLEVLPGGIFYFNIKDPLLEYDSKIDNISIEHLILKEFKMSGITLEDSTLINALDNNFRGESIIVPAAISEKDNTIKKSSSIASHKDFIKLQNFVNNKIDNIASRIISGDILPKPYKKGQKTGCDFCTFKNICQIDIFEDINYNNFDSIKKTKNIFDIFDIFEDINYNNSDVIKNTENFDILEDI